MSAPGPPEPVAIETLLRHRDWVRALARSLLLDRNRADDLEQETWRIVLERPPRHGSSLRAWFASVVRHAATTAGRREGTRRRHETVAVPREPAPSPDDAIAAAELQTRLARAVLDLEEPYRTVVVLRYFEGLETTEIASRTSAPVETVRTRLKRAIARLRERMEPDVRRDRDAWCLLVFGTRRIDAESAAAGGAGAAVVGGGLAMAVTAKLAAAGAIVAAGAAWWLWPEGDRDEVVPETASSPVPAAAPEPRTDDRTHRARPPALESADEVTAAAAAPLPEAPPGPDVVHGRVIDDATGAPVPDVTVSLVWESFRRPGSEPSATSRADGTFRIPGADEGKFGELLLQADGYAECLIQPPWKVESEKRTKYDAGDVRILRGRRVSGRVVAADGRTPVASASIRLSTSGESTSLLWVRESVERGTCGADGEFVLDRIAPSHRYPFTITVFAVAKDGIGWTKLPGDAGRVDTTGVVVALRPSGAATVAVRDESGRPQSGVQVVASPRFSPLGPRPEWQVGHDAYAGKGDGIAALFAASTDERGVARFAALPTVGESSRYDFVAYARGGKAWTDGVGVRPGETADVEIVVTPAGKRAVVGCVRDAGGAPIVGATVRCGYASETRVPTGADGRFRIDLGPAASWDPTWIEVTADGFAKVERTIRPDSKQTECEVDIVMRPAAPVEGSVVDQNGKPVARAWVRTPRDDASINGRAVETDADGRFAFADTVAGDVVLSVQPPPPLDEWGWAAVPRVRGGDRSVVIVQPRVAPGKTRIVATVVDETGAAVAPDEVWLHPFDEVVSVARMPFGRTELGNGRAVVERVHSGRWRLRLRVPGRIGVVAPVVVPEGQTEVAIRLVVGRPGSIRGRVVAGENGALPHAVTPQAPDDPSPPDWAVPHGRAMTGSARVEADGTFEFPEVMPGRWRIWATDRDLIGQAVADVPPGGEGTCVVTMTPRGTLSFRLSAVPASPLVGWMVALDADAFDGISTQEVAPGKPPAIDVRLHPGTYRWRLLFPAGRSAWDPRRAARTQEGTAVVASGETCVVEVPVVPE